MSRLAGTAWADPPPPIDTKPRWRGRLHSWALVAAVPAGVALVALAEGSTARVSAAIYALGLIGLFGVSALYHWTSYTVRERAWLRWLDHSMIFVFIAASYTPVCLVVLPRRWGLPMFATALAVAVIGVVVKLSRLRRFRRIGGALYMVMGWMAVVVVPQVVTRATVGLTLLMFAGGALFTIGTIVLFLRRPDPRPTVFGYHEVWHALTVAAVVCHFGMVLLAVRDPLV